MRMGWRCRLAMVMAMVMVMVMVIIVMAPYIISSLVVSANSKESTDLILFSAKSLYNMYR